MSITRLVPNLQLKYFECAFEMAGKAGVLYTAQCVCAFLCKCVRVCKCMCVQLRKSDYLSVCLWLLCVCAAADARSLGGIWLSGKALKWPAFVCVSMCAATHTAVDLAGFEDSSKITYRDVPSIFITTDKHGRKRLIFGTKGQAHLY